MGGRPSPQEAPPRASSHDPHHRVPSSPTALSPTLPSTPHSGVTHKTLVLPLPVASRSLAQPHTGAHRCSARRSESPSARTRALPTTEDMTVSSALTPRLSTRRAVCVLRVLREAQAQGGLSRASRSFSLSFRQPSNSELSSQCCCKPNSTVNFKADLHTHRTVLMSLMIFRVHGPSMETGAHVKNVCPGVCH